MEKQNLTQDFTIFQAYVKRLMLVLIDLQNIQAKLEKSTTLGVPTLGVNHRYGSVRYLLDKDTRILDDELTAMNTRLDESLSTLLRERQMLCLELLADEETPPYII
jgi:hypothetical protein